MHGSDVKQITFDLDMMAELLSPDGSKIILELKAYCEEEQKKYKDLLKA